MIQTKRQILTSRDRFGGFDAITNDSARPVMTSDITEPAAPVVEDIRRTADEPMSYAPPAAPLYTTRETVAPAPELPKRPEKVQAPLDREDLMPSIKTRRVAAGAVELEENIDLRDAIPDRRARRQLSPRTKVMLFVYVAIALVLAIAVIATGISISHTTAAASRMADEITAKQAVVARQQATIALKSDPDTIRDKAIEMGMTYAGDTVATATPVEKVDYPTPEPHTNAFDSFCDWMSGVVM